MKKILVGLAIISFFALAFSYGPNMSSDINDSDYSEYMLDDTIKKCCKKAETCNSACTKKCDKKCDKKGKKNCTKKCDKKKCDKNCKKECCKKK